MLNRIHKKRPWLGLASSLVTVMAMCCGGTPGEMADLTRTAQKTAAASRMATIEKYAPSLLVDQLRDLERTREMTRYPRWSPQAFVGTRATQRIDLDFGRFNYRRVRAGYIEVAHLWTEDNLVEVSCPYEGGEMKVKVHRSAQRQFEQAFRLIREKNLQHLVRILPDGNATFQQRFMQSPRARRNPRQELSLHCWGLAIDINNNGPSAKWKNHKLWREAFRPAGFRWGNDFLDPMHFEIAGMNLNRRPQMFPRQPGHPEHPGIVLASRR